MQDKKNQLHNERFTLGNRTFFLNLKESKKGTNYITITQSQKKEGEEGYDLNSIILFEEEVQSFAHAFSNLMIHFKKTKKDRPTQEEIETLRKQYPNAYKKWSEEEVEMLKQMSSEGKSVQQISESLQRQPGAIAAKMKKFELAAA